MMMRVFNWIKPVLGAVIVIALLQATGVMGSVSFYTQSALLKIGIRNASTKPLKNPETFDYNFKVRNSAGETITFDRYKGKVVFINVWATWCGPCRAEMPTIQSLYDQMDTTGIEFVMLSIDRDGDEPKIAKYIKQFKYTFPVYRPSGTLPPQIDTQYIPMTLIISKDGKIVNKEVGATNFDTPKFRKYLLSLTQ